MTIKLEPTNFHRKSSYQFENDNQETDFLSKFWDLKKNCQTKQFSNNEKNVNQCQFPAEFVMKKKKHGKQSIRLLIPVIRLNQEKNKQKKPSLIIESKQYDAKTKSSSCKINQNTNKRNKNNV